MMPALRAATVGRQPPPSDVADLTLVVRVVGGVRLASIAMLTCLPWSRLYHDPLVTPYIPVVLGVAVVSAAFSLVLLVRWQQLGARIGTTWWWPVIEAAIFMTLVVTHGMGSPIGTYVACTLALVAAAGGRRGAGIIAAALLVMLIPVGDRLLAAFDPGGVGLSFRTLSMVVYALAYLAVGVFSRSLLLEQGRAARLHAAAESQAAVAREQIRASDEVQSRLSATIDDAQAMADALARDLAGTGRGESSTLAQRLLDGLTRARTECDALSRGLNDDLPSSLPVACRAVVAEFAQNSPSVGVALNVPDESAETSPQACREVVRALRELLENVRQHSHADSVRVEVACTDDTVTLTVADNGVGLPNGFDADAFRRTGHFGLIGLAERAGWSGGSLDVTTPGRGANVRLTLPRWLDTDTKWQTR